MNQPPSTLQQHGSSSPCPVNAENEMSRVWVDAAAFQDEGLPMVCAKTGARADRMVCVQAAKAAGWTWWLLQYGPLPFQSARWLARRRITGWIPMAARPAARLKRIRYFSFLSLVAGTLAVIISMLISAPSLAQLAVVSLAVAITVAMVEPWWSVGAHLDPSADKVLLTRVHPRFRDAIQDVGSGTRGDRE
jgi:hypothetical protein